MMIKTKTKMITLAIKKNKMKGHKWQWERWIHHLSSQEKPRNKWRKRKNKKDAGKNKRLLRDNKKMKMPQRLRWAELEKEGRKALKPLPVGQLWKRVNPMQRDSKRQFKPQKGELMGKA